MRRSMALIVALSLLVGLLALLVVVRAPAPPDGAELLVNDVDGRPRIRSEVIGDQAVLEFLDGSGHVRAWIGHRLGQGAVGLSDTLHDARDAPDVRLGSSDKGLVARAGDSEVELRIGSDGVPYLGMRDGRGDRAWLVRGDPAMGLMEHRKRAPAPPLP
jgi:hypothetical protein